jgi:hypothetical protein
LAHGDGAELVVLEAIAEVCDGRDDEGEALGDLAVDACWE